jgi:hypothetical protein
MDTLVLLSFISTAAFAAMYMAPAILAFIFHHPYRWLILPLTLTTSWLIIPWMVYMVWVALTLDRSAPAQEPD